MPESPQKFRKSVILNQDTRDSQLAPIAIGLGILLIIGGIALGMSRSKNTVAQLPDYSPVYVSPIGSAATSPSPSPATSPEDTSVASYQEPEAPTYQAPNRITSSVKSTAKTNSVKAVVPAAPVTTQSATLPDYNPNTSLPDYTPAESLPEYQPQYVAPSPSPVQKQTISVSLTVPGKTYNLEVTPNSTVLAVMQTARGAGLSYTSETHPTYGEMIKSINGVGGDWVYEINGGFALGISSQTVKNGDSIVWKKI